MNAIKNNNKLPHACYCTAASRCKHRNAQWHGKSKAKAHCMFYWAFAHCLTESSASLEARRSNALWMMAFAVASSSLLI